VKNLVKSFFLFVIVTTGIGISHARHIDTKHESFIFETKYCINTQIDLKIDEVIHCQFVSKEDLPRGTLSDSTIWLRLHIKQKSSDYSALAIFVGPHFLGEIQQYEKLIDGWRVESAGSKIPFNDAHATVGGYLFQAHADENGESTIYFRIQRSGLGLILLDVIKLTPKDIMAVNQQLGIGIHIGALILILAFALFNFVMHPSALMYRFCWLTFVLILGILGGSGLLAKYVFDQHPWLNIVFFKWMICLRLACWVWVSQAFLKPYQTAPWYRISCGVIYILVAISMVLVVIEKIALLQYFLLVGFIATTIIQTVAIQKTPQILSTFRHILLAGFIVANALTFITVMLAAYPFSSAYTAVYISRGIDFVTPLVLLAIFAFRNRLMLREFDEVKTSNMQITMRLDFERKLLKERRVLLDMLTHELKNPLASISMAIGSLKQMLTSDQSSAQRRLHNMSQSVLNMDSIIERCHLMNQIDNKELSPKYERIHVSEFIMSIVNQFQEQNRIQLNLAPNIEIVSDPDFFRIILSNLIENALKYSPALSDIELKLELSGDPTVKRPTINLTISNLTKHNDAPDRENIFKRFYRDPRDLNMAGSGLGLHLVQELCIILSGSVHFLSEITRVTFQVVLPLNAERET
jgi:signal transduction histidine kinase